jgi:DUF1365 family protein
VVIEPGLYRGTLRHRRFAPTPHAFTYQVWMALLDIDRIPELMRASWLTSWNRWNWASYDDRDHLCTANAPLRQRVHDAARRQAIDAPDGPIFLLTNLRCLGYCFNPVSFYYLFDQAWQIQLVMAEVHNTFGGSHTYWLRPDAGRRGFRAAAEKSLYVSPFMPMNLNYQFALTPPANSLVAHIDTRDGDHVVLDATLTLERRPWNAAELRRLALRQPAMTAKVIAAIHWQALRLWAKGVRVVPRITANGES